MSKYDIELRHLDGQRLQITSLELYLYSKSFWADPTTHAARCGIKDQLSFGRWYVHRYKEGGKFRPPNRRCIDITAGSEKHEVHAGLLIRGINEIDGPALALNSFLVGPKPKGERRKWDYNGKDEFFKRLNGSDVESGSIAVVDAPIQRQCSFYVGRRKGLPKPKTELEERYFNSALRITTHPGNDLTLL